MHATARVRTAARTILKRVVIRVQRPARSLVPMNREARPAESAAQPGPRTGAQDWADEDEVLETDIAALKDLFAQRDAQAAQFRRLKDRLLGRG